MNTHHKVAAVSVLTIVFSASGAGAQTQRGGALNQETNPRAEPLLPTGQVKRYVVTNMVSEPNKVATAVTITNSSAVACSVSVDWFGKAAGALACTTNATLPAGQTTNLCSRNPGSAFVTCIVTCSPELTFDEGRAVVASTNNANCAKIAVDARVFFFNGSDAVLGGAYAPKIVKTGQGNSGN